MPDSSNGARSTADAADRAAERFCSEVTTALNEDVTAISDETVQRVLAAAIKIYAAKASGREGEIVPFHADAVTATEAVVTACAMIRAADLSLFDVAMWFGRPLGRGGRATE